MPVDATCNPIAGAPCTKTKQRRQTNSRWMHDSASKIGTHNTSQRCWIMGQYHSYQDHFSARMQERLQQERPQQERPRADWSQQELHQQKGNQWHLYPRRSRGRSMQEIPIHTSHLRTNSTGKIRQRHETKLLGP